MNMFETFAIGAILGWMLVYSYQQDKKRRMVDFKESMHIEQHPQYNPDTLRIEFTAEQINKMNGMYITKEQLRELQCTWAFNPLFTYPNGVKKLANEVGYDTKYRYQLFPKIL